MDAISSLRHAVATATKSWTGWDWPQDFLRPDGKVVVLDGDFCLPHVRELYGEEIYEAASAYAAEVAADAAAAAEAAHEALWAAEHGDWTSAVEHATRACRIESEYGDCQAYRLVLKAAEDGAQAAGLSRRQDYMYDVNHDTKCTCGAMTPCDDVDCTTISDHEGICPECLQNERN